MNQEWTTEEEAANLTKLLGDRNRTAFAREFGVPGGGSMIAQHTSGHRPISLTAATAYANGLGVPLAEISPRLAKVVDSIRPAGAPEPSNVTEAPALGPSRMVPVVGHVKGGVDGYLEEMNFPVGHGEGFVEYWTKDPQAYALRVKGDSMHPRYRAGEFIIVTPNIEPQPGRDVMVKLKDGRKLLKQLNWKRGDEMQLVSINDGYEPYTISTDEIESIQRVAGGVPSDAFEEARSH